MKEFKPSLIFRILTILILVSFLSCAPAKAGTKPVAVATIFPCYDFTRRIAGDRFEVKLLLPPGVEAHGYEPKPSDMAAVSRAAVFVFSGRYMEPWAPGLAKSADHGHFEIVDASLGVKLFSGHDAEPGHEGQGGFDPHIWLDPTLAAVMVDTIADSLARADPEGKAVFSKNAAEFKADLLALDARISSALAGAKIRTILYAGHYAFGYFGRRYGLDYVSPYKGFSPDSEPTPAAMAELIRAVRDTGSRTIFFEELLEPRIAETIARETGAVPELLHGAHNVTKEELSSGITYLSIMEANLGKLKDALGER